MKEIPAELLKQIEDEAEYRYDIMHDGQAHKDKMMFRRKAFIDGAKWYHNSFSPSSGEGEAESKKSISCLKCKRKFEMPNGFKGTIICEDCDPFMRI